MDTKAKQDMPFEERYKARKFENEGKWYEALNIYFRYGCSEDVAAINLILQAIEKGDRFRATVEQKKQSREEFIKNSTQTDSEIMQSAYNEVYGEI